MNPIRVPRPPKEAYNKNRPISDLIKAQLAHFQHIERKLPPEQQPKIPHHELTTESAAARYIAAMTAALCQGDGQAKVLTMPHRDQVRKKRKALQDINIPARLGDLAASSEEQQPAPAAIEGGAKKPKRSTKRQTPSKNGSKSR